MAEQLSAQPRGSLAPKRLMLLVTIVQKGKGTFFSDYLQTFETNLQICVVGTGTARADLVEFLGLKDNKRSVIFSVVREDKLDAILSALAVGHSAVAPAPREYREKMTVTRLE